MNAHSDRCVRPECGEPAHGADGLALLLCRQHYVSATAPPPPLSAADRDAMRRRWAEEPVTEHGTVPAVRASDLEPIPSELLAATLNVLAGMPGSTLLRTEPRYGPLV